MSAMVIQSMMDFSSQMTNNIAHLAEGVRVDAAHWEDAMRHESLAREQCHQIQANERDRIQRDEALQREKSLKQDALERDRVLREEALERDKLQKQEVLEREKFLKQEALERDRMQKQEATELRQEAAGREEKATLREERMRAERNFGCDRRLRQTNEIWLRRSCTQRLKIKISSLNSRPIMSSSSRSRTQK